MLFQETNAHLGFGVGAQPRDGARAPELRHLGVELVGQDDGERHALLRFVGGIAEHQTLGGQKEKGTSFFLIFVLIIEQIYKYELSAWQQISFLYGFVQFQCLKK